MLRGAVARRYAQALYEIGEATNSLEVLEKELKEVAETVEGSRELQKVLYHPQVLPTEKKKILKAIFGAEYSAEAMKFLACW
ncbi:hypothetical protein N752_30405 [Desulforamulus aquiferis]|nr:hypothetical protein N752_30405 [Desulforamulus aquiferis]